jgi:hypothetical protein
MFADPADIARIVAQLLRLKNPDPEQPRDLILPTPDGLLGLASAPWPQADAYVVALFDDPGEEPRFSAVMHEGHRPGPAAGAYLWRFGRPAAEERGPVTPQLRRCAVGASTPRHAELSPRPTSRVGRSGSRYGT